MMIANSSWSPGKLESDEHKPVLGSIPCVLARQFVPLERGRLGRVGFASRVEGSAQHSSQLRLAPIYNPRA